MTTRFNKIVTNTLVVLNSTTSAVGTTSGTTILVAADSGKTYDISGGAQTITLPKAIAGATLKFVVSTNISGIINIACHTSDVYKGALLLVEESLEPFLINKTDADSNNNLTLTATTTAGSFIELVCITSGSWIVTGTVYTTSTYSTFN